MNFMIDSAPNAESNIVQVPSNEFDDIVARKVIDEEIQNTLKLIEKLKFKEKIEQRSSNRTLSTVVEHESFNDEDEIAEYELSENRTFIKELKINLGTNDLPRYSCACHKNNIAVRMAIKKHSLAKNLRKLTR